jgi:hypothetical protein
MKKSLTKFVVWTIVFVAAYGLSKYYIIDSLPKTEGFGNYAIIISVFLILIIPFLIALWNLVLLIGKLVRVIDDKA